MAGQNQLILTLAANVRDFNSKMNEARKTAEDSFDGIKTAAQELTAVFGGFAAGGAVLTKNFLQSAAQMEDFESTLRAVTGSTEEAQRQLKSFVDFAAKTPFELPQVVEAGIKLQSLGVSADKTLPRIAALAAAMKKDLPESALVIGKATIGVKDAVTQIRDSFGITVPQLEKFGATVNKQGEIVVDNAKDLAKFNEALNKLLDNKYGDVIAQQANNISVAFSSLKDAAGQLEAGLGKAIGPQAVAVANVLSDMIKKFNELPDATKSAIAGTIAIGGALASLAAAVTAGVVAFTALAPTLGPVLGATVELGGVLPAVIAGFTGIAEAITTAVTTVEVAVSAFGALGGAGAILSASLGSAGSGIAALATGAAAALGPAGLLIAALTALSVGLVQMTASQEEANKALDGQIHRQVQAIKNYREQIEVIGKTAEELRKLGKTDLDITKEIAGLERLAQAARESGNEEKAKQYEAEIERLRKIRVEFRGTEDAKQAAIAETLTKQKAAADKASKDYEQFEKDRQNGVFETKAAELAAAKEVLAALTKEANEIKKVDETRYNELMRRAKALKEGQTKLAREARKEQADLALKSLEQEVQAGKVSKDEEAKRLKEIGKQFADVKGFQADVAAKAEAQIKAAIEERLAAEEKSLQLEQEVLAGKIASYEKQIQLGNDVAKNSAQIATALKERQKLEEESVRRNAELAKSKTQDPTVRAQIEKQADLEVKKSKQELAAAQLDLADKVRKAEQDRLQTQLQLKEATKSTADVEISALQERLANGENVGKQLRNEIAVRQKLEQAIIQQKKAEQLAGETNPAKRAAIEAKANAELANQKIKNAQETKNTEVEIGRANAQRVQDAIELQKKEQQANRDALEERRARGQNVREEELRLRKADFELERQSIQAKADADKLGKSAVDQARIQREAELDIEHARRQAKNDLKEINKAYADGTDELQKQKDELKSIQDKLAELRGEKKKDEDKGPIIGGVDELVKQQERDAEIGRLEDEERRRKNEVDRKEKTQKGIEQNQAEGDRFGKTEFGQNPAQVAAEQRRNEIEQQRAEKNRQEAEARRLAGRAQAETRLRAQGKSDDDIQKILANNFDKPAAGASKSSGYPSDIPAKDKDGIAGGSTGPVGASGAGTLPGGSSVEQGLAYLATIAGAVPVVVQALGAIASTAGAGKQTAQAPNAAPPPEGGSKPKSQLSKKDVIATSPSGYPGLDDTSDPTAGLAS